MNVSLLLEKQRSFFNAGKTKDIRFRRNQLKILKRAVKEREEDLLHALHADLRKPRFEAYVGEVGMVHTEIDHVLKHLSRWMQPKKARTPPFYFPAKSFVYPEPYGMTLIISTWNYPVQLFLMPLIGAIAAGNCAILKPSEIAPASSVVVTSLIADYFDPAYATAIEGGIDIGKELLRHKFDYIFFTGSQAVGKKVMAAAAEHLTPLTIESGGKSPCIVDKNVDINMCAKRIVWGKFFNAGQTCVSPEYVLVHKDVQAALLAALKKEIQTFYGDDPSQSDDYTRIINQQQIEKISRLFSQGKIIVGGEIKKEDRYVAPTIIANIKPDHTIMHEEIFGPILPVLCYEDLAEALEIIMSKPKPLALYIFSKNKSLIRRVLAATSSGGVTVNDTMLHSSTMTLPFGGVGASGFGAYHGKASFDTFTHYKSVMHRSFWFDIALRYPPYKNKYRLLRKIFSYFF